MWCVRLFVHICTCIHAYSQVICVTLSVALCCRLLHVFFISALLSCIAAYSFYSILALPGNVLQTAYTAKALKP